MLQDRRIRLFFRADQMDRQICWFEMNGDDFYLGSAAPDSADIPSISFSDDKVTIQVPEEIRRIPESGLKASFHASGQFHVRAGRLMKGDPEHWPKKSKIVSPFRVAALMSKSPLNYPPYARSLTRGRADALVIRIPDNQANARHYFEFFISPPGEFQRPPSMIKVKEEVVDALICRSLSERLILVIRHFVFARTMLIHDWHPELEVWFFAKEAVSSD